MENFFKKWPMCAARNYPPPLLQIFENEENEGTVMMHLLEAEGYLDYIAFSCNF